MKYTLNYKYFEKWTPGMAWVLGLIASDGCVYLNYGLHQYQLIISMKDLDILEKVKGLMGSSHLIKKVSYFKFGKKRTIFRFVIANKQLVKSLVRIGIPPRKSKTIKLPRVPSKYFAHFVRGLFDGDGNVNITQGYKLKKSVHGRIYTGSKAFAQALLKNLRKHDIPFSFQHHPHTFMLVGSEKFWPWLYKNSENIRGTRKFIAVTQHIYVA